MKFEDLGLRAALLRAVRVQGYTVPTPIQELAIPAILQGRDVMAAAQTGSGKTAAYALPTLQLLMGVRRLAPRTVRGLVLVPTRELAAQVAHSIRTFSTHLPLRCSVIFGGIGLSPQIESLRQGVDIVVATPGRLLDHAARRSVDLSMVEVFVLDEADRMLDMGFIHDVRRVFALMPARRQNLLFSATFPSEVQALAGQLLHNPAVLALGTPNSSPATIEQTVYHVERARKTEALVELIQRGGWSRALVFTRTKHGADRLARRLASRGITAEAIHGNKSQSARTRALASFKAGQVRALIATEVAARGLDIEDLPHVVNFDLPLVAEDYVHRIGRTGRAGADGHATSLVCPEEIEQLQDIQRLIGRKLTLNVLHGFEKGESGHADSRMDPRDARPSGRRRRIASSVA